jgi:hypothetical protein
MESRWSICSPQTHRSRAISIARRWQLSRDAAGYHQQFIVPVLLRPWAAELVRLLARSEQASLLAALKTDAGFALLIPVGSVKHFKGFTCSTAQRRRPHGR